MSTTTPPTEAELAALARELVAAEFEATGRGQREGRTKLTLWLPTDVARRFIDTWAALAAQKREQEAARPEEAPCPATS